MRYISSSLQKTQSLSLSSSSGLIKRGPYLRNVFPFSTLFSSSFLFAALPFCLPLFNHYLIPLPSPHYHDCTFLLSTLILHSTMASNSSLLRHFIVLLLAFAFLCIFMAQGRQFPNAHLMKDEEISAKMRSMIGSRPPKCDERCRNCGRCEAVQVPIAPAIKQIYGKIPTNTIEYSRGDDVSSYKPMCWKCKCGNFFFNP